MSPENPRYKRQVRAEGFGPEAQARLARARVGIVGLGALGSRVAEDLARAGFGFLRLIDRDWVELSNLHRQHLYDEQDARAEEPKSLAAARRIAAINSEVRLDPELRDLGPEDVDEVLGDLDLWIDGTDNFQTRYLLNDFAVRTGRPWIYGACVASQAMVAHFVPGGSCLRCLFPEPPPAESTQTCETSGIIPPAAAFVASLQSAIAMRLVGRPDEALVPRLFTADLRTLEIRDMTLPGAPGADCESCSNRSYPALRLVSTSRAKRLCGRNAVQLSPPAGEFPELEVMARKLDGHCQYELSAYMLRIRIDEGQITVFPGGRAIVQGTDEPGRARALFDRYLGT